MRAGFWKPSIWQRQTGPWRFIAKSKICLIYTAVFRHFMCIIDLTCQPYVTSMHYGIAASHGWRILIRLTPEAANDGEGTAWSVFALRI